MKSNQERQKSPASIWSNQASTQLDDPAAITKSPLDRTVVDGPETLTLPDVKTLINDKPSTLSDQGPATQIKEDPTAEANKNEKTEDKKTDALPDATEHKLAKSAIRSLERAGYVTRQGSQYTVVETADFTVDHPTVAASLKALPSTYGASGIVSASAVQSLVDKVNEVFPAGFGIGPKPEKQKEKASTSKESPKADAKADMQEGADLKAEPTAEKKSAPSDIEARDNAEVAEPTVEKAATTSEKDAEEPEAETVAKEDAPPEIYVTPRGVVTGIKEIHIEIKAAYDIAFGDSWSNHQTKWREKGIDSPKELAKHLESIMKDPSDKREDSHKGRIAYWDEATKTLIVETSSETTQGTAYIPEEEKQAFYDLR